MPTVGTVEGREIVAEKLRSAGSIFTGGLTFLLPGAGDKNMEATSGYFHRRPKN